MALPSLEESGYLGNHDGNGSENAALKYKFTLLELLCDYCASFNFYNELEVTAFKIKKKKGKNSRSCAIKL